MQEIEIKLPDGREYILNNNSGKHERAKINAGKDASDFEILAAYDKLGGLILDKKRQKIENGLLSKEYDEEKKEHPRFIKIIEDRIQSLEVGENKIIEFIIKNLDHKRAFIGTLMTIAGGILAGLFFLFTKENSDISRFGFLARFGGNCFALFIIISAFYLISILSQESISLDKKLDFIRKSREKFIERLGDKITNLKTYEKYREIEYKKEMDNSEKKWFTEEKYFKIVCGLFVISCATIFILFWLVSL
jgi:hypothetical protein